MALQIASLLSQGRKSRSKADLEIKKINLLVYDIFIIQFLIKPCLVILCIDFWNLNNSLIAAILYFAKIIIYQC